MRVLILFAHPAYERSRINRRLVDAVTGLDGVTVHDLYEAYPDFAIDVEAEQKLLLEHDVIIFHHPLFWYSSPALLKEWQDLVLTHGWAYGAEGTALMGKLFMQTITTGAGVEKYCAENHCAVRSMLLPFEMTAQLCNLRVIAPFAVFGTFNLDPEKDMLAIGEEYRRVVTALRDESLDLDAAAAAEVTNAAHCTCDLTR
ncbi:NAD(P)H-dependent oxidoreductase [Sulfuriroseicoccus oceanibius]|uniref:NAD(P)H-dependent oxidoreductase n=1 Tax=Sulfuriroseicoccus oceanibius TaxID=2707525 RepID=A0A6B3LE95_9BACT|nr:NAD(P)H-dependent oxidoreductase [Sulfuriroseicoccus oceanibius]QQL45388.1 NAD(P)H-dependent oxidoreductase [Sulfuriroseicoccus oceanibius]